MKKVFFALAIATISLISYSAETNSSSASELAYSNDLKIKVIDQLSGEALTGVAVELGGLKGYTDFDGELTFENITPGKHEVKTSFISYNSSNKMITINSSTTELALEIEAIDSK